MPEEKFAIVTDDGTQWITYLVRYEDSKDGCNIKECHDVDNRVLRTDFCENIFSRPYETNLFRDMSINSIRGFYGWHVGNRDFDRIRDLIKAAKSVDTFERLAKY